MSAILFLPTQLFDLSSSFLSKYDTLVVLEEPFYINPSYHIQKIYLHLASVRSYVAELKQKHKNVVHIQYHELQGTRTEKQNAEKYRSIISKRVSQKRDIRITVFDPIDSYMVNTFKHMKHHEMLDSPAFICSRKEIEDYDSSLNTPKSQSRISRSMTSFYKWQRRRLNVFMDGDKPIGGKWSFDSANRSRFESDYKEAKAKEYPIDKKIKEYIDLHFASHLGELKSYYPVNRKEAQAVARKTINSKLLFFGKYQDAISDSVMYGYHTNLSALINIGLLAPKFIIDYAISKYNSLVKKGSHTEDLIYMRNSTEALIRQIIGWREYMRYMYYIYKDRIINGSVIRGTRSLGSAWYTAKTNLPTIDSAINKCLSHAYLHHIERLMLINNIMVIDSIRYRDVYRWFMRMFIDSYDWVMATNLMMNTNSSNQSIRFMTRMYICSASYIKKMSNPGYLDADTTAYLNNRYKRFMIENHEIAVRDYGLASSAKRIEREAQKKKLR